MSNPDVAAPQAEIRRLKAEIAALKDEIQDGLKDQVETYNILAEVLREHGILRGREMAEFTARTMESLKAEESPSMKGRLLNAHIRQQISHVRRALQARPPASPSSQGTIQQAISKIQLRALAIVEHVKILAEGKERIAFNSGQARDYLAGREGKPPSRRDAIRALRRAEKICPALICDHTPNDGRQTMRLTARAEDLKHSEIIKEDRDRTTRQRSRMEELRMIFFKEGVF